ncbi:Homeodomain-like protein, partial [Dimargaris cristalligena]
WSAEEVDLLNTAIGTYGTSDWLLIAKAVGTRSGMQCFLRYHRNRKMAPGESKRAWTRNEDNRIRRLVAKHGHRWKSFEPKFPGRTN